MAGISHASSVKQTQGAKILKSTRGKLLTYLSHDALFSAGDIAFNSSLIRSLWFDCLSGAIMFIVALYFNPRLCSKIIHDLRLKI